MRFRPPAWIAVALMLVAALAPVSALAATRAGATSLVSLESRILVDLNRIRADHGLLPLRPNPELEAAAAEHADEMLADGYFGHNSADGTAFWQRIGLFYPYRHYAYWAVGENLLWTPTAMSAVSALRLWMRSPEHRANILRARWREIGIAAQYEPDAPGTYDGYNVTVLAADFGTRR